MRFYDKLIKNKEFSDKNRQVFKLSDTLFALAILFNLFAVILTNALVVKETPDKQFVEVNPLQAKMNNLKTTNPSVFISLLKQFYLWLIIFGLYFYCRVTISTKAGLLFHYIITFWIFYTLAWDFCNDFGFWIGKQLFGV